MVNANPAVDQLESALRTFITVVGLVLPLVGLAKYTGVLNVLLANLGVLAMLVSAAIGLGAVVWGQIKIRTLSTKAAAMAVQLPDKIATTK